MESIYANEKRWNSLLSESARANPAFALPDIDPRLPNALLIGDSISIGYTKTVREMLRGRFNVFRISENGADTATGLKRIDLWLDGRHWDVIHFN